MKVEIFGRNPFYVLATCSDIVSIFFPISIFHQVLPKTLATSHMVIKTSQKWSA
jgi:hypothetical protein